mmetsp:Transcript_9961/g.30663  ORF Transcript_9961/g.30663 Transcript_9961/m.30663 type:complete len:217 (+) Transcript_9961:233-883(+)
MKVVFTVGRQIVVDHQRHLSNINTTSPHICRDKDTCFCRTEASHNRITFLLMHLTMHSTDSKVSFDHALGQAFNLFSSVAKDDSLSDCQRIVEITERVKLPFLMLHSHEKLLDTIQSKFITLHQDADRLVHKLLGDRENLWWKSRRHQHNLCGRRQITIDIVDLLLETHREHLISLIQNQHLDRPCTEVTTFDHIKHASRCSRHNMHTVVKLANIF